MLDMEVIAGFYLCFNSPSMSFKSLEIPTKTQNKAISTRVSCCTIPSVLTLRRAKSIKNMLKLFTKDLNFIKTQSLYQH